MNYIVFDLEWNQCPTGKPDENEKLPFEIIEIGAVKLNEEKKYLDSFRALVKPKIYRRLHFQTQKVIGLTMEDLNRDGIPFEQAAEKFLDWCGEEPRFCTWGTLDLMELQRNLAFYGMIDRLKGPIFYEDVQKLFAICYETRRDRRALSYAVEYLHLPEDGAFHFAKEDAAYTARVLQTIPDDIIRENYSIDCWQNPKSRGEEIHIHYATYDKYISREFDTKEELMADPDVSSVRCFICHRNVRRVIRWFADGGKNHLAVGCCPKHGFVKCKVRVKESADGHFYAVKTTKMISEEDMEKIRGKQIFHRIRRQRKAAEREEFAAHLKMPEGIGTYIANPDVLSENGRETYR